MASFEHAYALFQLLLGAKEYGQPMPSGKKITSLRADRVPKDVRAALNRMLYPLGLFVVDGQNDQQRVLQLRRFCLSRGRPYKPPVRVEVDPSLGATRNLGLFSNRVYTDDVHKTVFDGHCMFYTSVAQEKKAKKKSSKKKSTKKKRKLTSKTQVEHRPSIAKKPKKRDLSVVSIYGQECRMMGPAALLNYACRDHANLIPCAPRHVKVSRGWVDSDWQVFTVCRPINIDEEFTVSYGDDWHEDHVKCGQCDGRQSKAPKFAQSRWHQIPVSQEWRWVPRDPKSKVPQRQLPPPVASKRRRQQRQQQRTDKKQKHY